MRLSSLPLFWRVFYTNAAVLVFAFLALVLAPVTVSVPPHLTELIVLAFGLAGMLVITLVLLRPAFRPLDQLADTMRQHDPLSPGLRAHVNGEPDVAALAQTFNDMLDRLESERRESAHRALMVQEGERQRIARELHDEVGQTLTGVMLQVEGLAAVIPDERREQLNELRETARQGTEDVRRIARRLRPEALEDLGLQSALAALAGRIGEQAHIPIGPLLIVRDDGRGLDPGARSSSHGIRGMRERAMLIGAELAIGPAPGRGTEVKLTIPSTPLTHDYSPEDPHPHSRRPPDRLARTPNGARRPSRPRGRRRGDRR